MPKLKDFKSIIKFLNIGGEHQGAITNDNTLNAFKKDDFSYADNVKHREIALELLSEALILEKLDGKSTEAKQKRTELLIKHFGNSSKTYIENLEPEIIETNTRNIKIELGLIDVNKEPQFNDKEQLNF